MGRIDQFALQNNNDSFQNVFNYENEEIPKTKNDYFNPYTGKMDRIGDEPYFVPKNEPIFDEEGNLPQVNRIDKMALTEEDSGQNEGWGKWFLRTLGSIGTGIASGATWQADVANIAQMGSALDPNTIEELQYAHEKLGKDFNEEEYRNAVYEIGQNFPTASNIARGIENKTGIPLTPKTGTQQFANFIGMAGKLAPKGGTIRPLKTPLPRPVQGLGVASTAEIAKTLGVNDTIADIGAFGILKMPNSSTFGLEKQKKPSGLVKRGFEDVKKERTVSQNKINQINKNLKKDFKEISDNIIADSDVGATKKALLENPSYKNETTELFKEADNIASNIKKTISKETHSKEIARIAQKESTGYRKNEYQREYQKFMLDAQKNIRSKNISASSLLEQYRNNNQELTGYFESGRSKNFNLAKRDALLSENRAIAEVFEKYYPESNLSTIFKEGNDRWTKIKNLEMVEEFTSELFKEGVNYKKINDFFNKTGYDKSFKRALGEKGYKQFEQLMKDMLQGEQGYKMLTVAKDKGFDDLLKMGMSYILHPKIAIAKGSFDIGKYTIKNLFNAMLDKPKLTFVYRKAVKDLKAGKFKEAEAGFKTLNEAIKPSEIVSPTKVKLTPKIQEPIDVKVEPVKPNATKQDALNKFNERKSITKTESAKPVEKEASKIEPKQIE